MLAKNSFASCYYHYEATALLSLPLFFIGLRDLPCMRNFSLLLCLYLQGGGDPPENPGPQQPGGPADREGGTQPEEDRGGDRDHD